MANDVQATDARVIGEQAALSILQHDIQPTLVENMGIIFETFTSEKHEIIEQGYVDKALSLLREKNLTYESESAVWLKTTKFGDDKDRVLVKSDGTRTYFASDCGYLLFKMGPGFARFVLTLVLTIMDIRLVCVLRQRRLVLLDILILFLCKWYDS